MERRDDIERLTRLETKTEALVENHKEMDSKLDTIIGGLTELKMARTIENEARMERRISGHIKEAVRLIAAAISGAGGAAAAGKAQAIAEQVTPHVR